MGTAMSAAPSTWKVPPRPAYFADPETCSASSAPTATPAERPTPPSICEKTREVMVRRWRSARSRPVVAGGTVVTGAVSPVPGHPGLAAHHRWVP